MAARKPAAKPKKAAAKKPAAKKPAAKAKKAPAKKAPAKKAAKAAPAKKAAGPVKEKYNKTQILAEIADKTGLSKKQVGGVLEELTDMVDRHICKRGCGEFVLPGLLKVTTVKKPARKAKKNVPNPFKPGEFMDVAAKPASTTVKIRPLKALKEMVV